MPSFQSPATLHSNISHHLLSSDPACLIPNNSQLFLAVLLALVLRLDLMLFPIQLFTHTHRTQTIQFCVLAQILGTTNSRWNGITFNQWATARYSSRSKNQRSYPSSISPFSVYIQPSANISPEEERLDIPLRNVFFDHTVTKKSRLYNNEIWIFVPRCSFPSIDRVWWPLCASNQRQSILLEQLHSWQRATASAYAAVRSMLRTRTNFIVKTVGASSTRRSRVPEAQRYR